MRNAVLSGGNGLGGAAAGMPDLVPVCSGGGLQVGGAWFPPWKGGGGKAWGTGAGALLPAWKGCAGNVGGQGPAPPWGWPAASLDPSRLPAPGEASGSKRKA